jgi:hypothetical protein
MFRANEANVVPANDEGDRNQCIFKRPYRIVFLECAVLLRPVAKSGDIAEGDFLKDFLPKGYDAVLLAHVVHALAPEQNLELLRQARQSVTSGTRLLIVDFWMDATHTEPLMGALMAGEFLVVGGNGDVYSVEEGRKWLEQSGWRYVEHKPLSGPVTLLVAEAIDSGVPTPSA